MMNWKLNSSWKLSVPMRRSSSWKISNAIIDRWKINLSRSDKSVEKKSIGGGNYINNMEEIRKPIERWKISSIDVKKQPDLSQVESLILFHRMNTKKLIKKEEKGIKKAWKISAINPDDLYAHIDPYLYHHTFIDHLPSIAQYGLLPKNQAPTNIQKFQPKYHSRPDHTYWGNTSFDPIDSDEAPILRVHHKYLDPNLINPDEDYLKALEEQGYGPKFNIPPYDEKTYKSLGNWAHNIQRDDPEITQGSLNNWNTISYNNPVPPEHLEYFNGREWNPISEFMTPNRVGSRKQSGKDDLFIALGIPPGIRDKIHNWVKKQDWPEDTELEDPDNYHITLIYTDNGYKEHKDKDWWHTNNIDDVEFKSLHEFPASEGEKAAYVLRVDSNGEIRERMEKLLDKAEDEGVEIKRFDGDSKPHITVAYGIPGKCPKITPPNFKFDTDEAYAGEPLEDGALDHPIKKSWKISQDYRIEHEAPGPNDYPFHDLESSGAKDLYNHPEWYSDGNPETDNESIYAIRNARNNPNALVTIHRAAPVNQINAGDWVTPSYAYAKQHGMHPTDPSQDMKVWSAKVPASTLFWDGNSINEFGYHGPSIEGQKFYRIKSGSTLRPAAEIQSNWKVSIPADPAWYWDRYLQPSYPPKPKFFYHGTDSSNLGSIMQNGLIPFSQRDLSDSDPIALRNRHEKELPRPGHVYMAENPQKASELALANRPVVLQINPEHLNPNNINPDEDNRWNEWQNNPEYSSGGQWAEQNGYGNNPEDTHQGIEKENTLAYRGIVPPKAIIPHWEDNEGNLIEIPREYWNGMTPQQYRQMTSKINWKVSDHKLWFNPNKNEFGKGFIDPNGDVHTWNESEGSHNQVARIRGWHPADVTKFHIQPDGLVTIHDTPTESEQEILEPILQADPRLSNWKISITLKKPNKFETDEIDHERGKAKWGLPKSHKRSAADPQWLQEWIATNGPYMFHSTSPKAKRKILKEGLIPHDQGPGSVYQGAMTPRANHSYLRHVNLGPHNVAVDLRKIDPNTLNADEDAFMHSGIQEHFNLHPSAIIGQEPNTHVVEDVGNGQTQEYPHAGAWVDYHNLNDPSHVAHSLNYFGTVAVHGGVPPEAIMDAKGVESPAKRIDVPYQGWSFRNNWNGPKLLGAWKISDFEDTIREMETYHDGVNEFGQGDPNQADEWNLGDFRIGNEWFDGADGDPLPKQSNWKISMAITPKMLEQWAIQHPYAYHETEPQYVQQIENKGLIPTGQTGIENHGGSDPNHVYLSLPGHPHHSPESSQFRIPLHKLDPSKMNFDADWLEDIDPEGYENDANEGWNVMNQHYLIGPEHNTPANVNRSMQMGSFAYNGEIPPEFIERNPDYYSGYHSSWKVSNNFEGEGVETSDSEEKLRLQWLKQKLFEEEQQNLPSWKIGPVSEDERNHHNVQISDDKYGIPTVGA